MVKVGNNEWVLVKRTPRSIRAAMAGAVSGRIVPGRSPSATNSTTLRVGSADHPTQGRTARTQTAANGWRMRNSPEQIPITLTRHRHCEEPLRRGNPGVQHGTVGLDCRVASLRSSQ